MTKHIPQDICDRIYDILVEHTNAPEQYRSAFMHYYADPTNPTKPTEFRGCPRWGMAGKFWWANNKFYVTGHSPVEFSNEKDFEFEQAQCDSVTALLKPLYEEFTSVMEK